MSIIVAVKKGRRTIVASDTLVCFGSHRTDRDNVAGSKVLRVGPSLIACTGWSLYDNIIQDYLKRGTKPVLKDETSIYRFMLKLWTALGKRYALVNQQCNEKDSPFADLDASFLIAHRTGIFGVSSDMSVTRYHKYHAIGCGSEYAYGALLNLYDRERHPRTIAEQAVRTAMHFDIHCGGEVESHELKG